MLKLNLQKKPFQNLLTCKKFIEITQLIFRNNKINNTNQSLKNSNDIVKKHKYFLTNVKTKNFCDNINNSKSFINKDNKESETENYNLSENQNSGKLYKLTLTGLDKFLSIQEINSKISELSDLKILRIEKKTSKNYGHADILTKLPLENLKLKFQSLKILGKSVKIRIREPNISDDPEYFNKNYTFFDFEKFENFEEDFFSYKAILNLRENENKSEKINVNNSNNIITINNDNDKNNKFVREAYLAFERVKESQKICLDNIYLFVHQFYLKNLIDNPKSIKFLLEKFVGYKENNIKEFDSNKIKYDNTIFVKNTKYENINYNNNINININKIFEVINISKEIYNY
jgi:hypothetical protein